MDVMVGLSEIDDERRAFRSTECSYRRTNGHTPMIGIRLASTKNGVEDVCWRPGAFPVRARCLEIDQDSVEGRYTQVLGLSIITIDADNMVVGEGPRRPGSRLGELGLRQSKHLFDAPPADPRCRPAVREAKQGIA